MQSYYYILEIAIILFATKILGLISKKVQMPQVVGALLAGIIIGPCMLNLVVENQFISMLSELGVIFLMFIAGAETDVTILKKQGKVSFIVALLGVLIPFIGGFLVAYIFTNMGIILINQGSTNILQSCFIGVILTATSVSITVETLREMNKLNSEVGNTILGAAIIDDILGIIALSIVSSISSSSVSVINVIMKICLYFIFIAIGSGVFYKIFKYLFEKSQKNSQTNIILVIVFCLVLSFVSEEMFGIADITGAFIAGLIISVVNKETEFVVDVIDKLSFSLLSPIFFSSIGLKLVLPQMSMLVICYTFMLTTVAILTKIVGCGIGAKVFKFSSKESIQIGFGMISRGEVALIVANKGVKLGIISNEVFTPILIVVIITTVISPILLKLAFREKEDSSSILKNTIETKQMNMVIEDRI